MNRYVITLITNPETKKLSMQDVDAAKLELSALGYQVEKHDWLAKDEACDVFVMGNELPALALNKIDAIAQNADNRKKKLLISDMDSTMIQQECIDELAAEVGKKEEVEAMTKAAMGNTNIDFKTSLRSRLWLLKGVEKAALECVYNRIQPMHGAEELLKTMHQDKDFVSLLVSGGFTFFTGKVAARLGFTRHYGGELQWDEDDKLTGTIDEPIYDKEAKREVLRDNCRERGIDLKDTIAIGDGSNDVLMIQEAAQHGGLGIMYHASDKVRALGGFQQINHANLRGVLFAQGYKLERGQFKQPNELVR